MGEHGRSDLDKEGVEVALVPLLENLADLGGIHAERLAHEVVSFGDDLHVGVFDAVVDHLHEVAGAVLTNVGAAHDSVHMGGDLLEHRAEAVVACLRPAGHNRGAVEGALFTAGDTRADEVEAARTKLLLAAYSVGEQRVAAVHDDVALDHAGREFFDHGIGSFASLDHDDRDAGPLKRGDEFVHGFRGHELAVLTVLSNHTLGLFHGTVVNRHFESVAGKVTGEVRAHDRHAGHADVGDRMGGGIKVGHARAAPSVLWDCGARWRSFTNSLKACAVYSPDTQ